jgi:xanthine dehydrogenase accessory factor
MDSRTLLPIVLGAGDIGSAVAHRLKTAGLHPLLIEGPAPLVTRRRMAFGGAVHEGRAELEGIAGVRCAEAARALALRSEAGAIPVLVVPGAGLEPALRPDALVDARMRKREQPAAALHLAPLVIGIGPGFTAGLHAHAVIESDWGEGLGAVLWQGRAREYTGRHREVGGFGKERYAYAPQAGRFRTGLAVLDPVRAGQELGRVGELPLRAEISGILRGLAHDGVEAAAGAKLAEIDPSGDPARCVGIGERPARIAQGVLEAIRLRWPDAR